MSTKEATKEQDNKTAVHDNIVIHVCDEARNVKKDFVCQRDLLTRGMKYFESYLEDSQAYEEIDISVHCDVQIFEWLMTYMSAKEHEKPQLVVPNIVSILISSDFLQMKALVDECLRFFKGHIAQILKLPVDLSCLSTRVMDQLSEMFSVEEIEAVKDKKDKITSQVYRRKVGLLLSDEDNLFHQCSRCRQLYTDDQKEWAHCTQVQPFIDYRGNVIANHKPTIAFDIKKHLLALRSSRVSWRHIYWSLWSVCTSMMCTTCHHRFQSRQINLCSHHTRDPIFLRGENTGFYACCDSSVFRFDPFPQRGGCKQRKHTVALDGVDAHTIHSLLTYKDLIPLVPLQFDSKSQISDNHSEFRMYSIPGSEGVETKAAVYPYDYDEGDLDYALSLAQPKRAQDDYEEDEDEDDVASQTGRDVTYSYGPMSQRYRPLSRQRGRVDSVGSGYSSGSGSTNTSSTLGRRNPYAASGSRRKTIVLGKKIGGRDTTTSSSKSRDRMRPRVKKTRGTDGSPSRTWKNDFLRHNDRKRMGNLIEKLTKLRVGKGGNNNSGNSGNSSSSGKRKSQKPKHKNSF